MMDIPNLNEMSFNTAHEFVLAFWSSKVFQHPLIQKKLKKTKQPGRRYREIDAEELISILGVDVEELEDEQKNDFLNQLTKSFVESYSQSDLVFEEDLNTNLIHLTEVLDLSETEVKMVRFFTLLDGSKDFDNVVDMLGELNKQQVIEVVAWVLDLSKDKVNDAFSNSGVLYETGIVKIDPRYTNELGNKVDVLKGLGDLLTSKDTSANHFLERFFRQSSAGDLTQTNFPHLQDHFEYLQAYLGANRHKGINVLVYGPPGTGKTQWVKLFAQSLGYSLCEVSDTDEDNDAVDASKRVEMYRLAQRALRQTEKSFLMFDEIEDVFTSDVRWLFGARKQNQSKSWLNKLLEENPVPSFWISNAVNQIDDAYLRRFDFVIEIDIPPRSVRKQIIDGALGELSVREEWKDKLAEFKHLSPALMRRVGDVVNRSSDKANLSIEQTEQKLLQLMNASLSAQSKPEVVIQINKGASYSLEYVNTDVDVESLITGLQKRKSGRFCFYGVPGTGKTALGNYIAQALDKPLIVKRASDLLSMYVGEAEKNIAKAFKEAKREGAVLQIDEADSFLQARENAQSSWEVTQVNELLTQMENFEGVFIASTNFMDNFDSAAMRRFDMKLELKPLTPEQSLKMFKNVFANVAGKEFNDDKLKDQIQALDQLTPGDFAAVSRKIDILGIEPTAELMIDNLKEECSYKPSYRTSNGIGFLSSVH